MFRKKRLLAIIIIITILLSIFPSIASQSYKIKSEETTLGQSLNIQDTQKIQDIRLNIIISDRDGNVEKILKKITKTELDKIKSNLIKILKSDLDYIEKFEYVLEELKENNLISSNIKLEDIIDFTKFENNPLKFKNVTNKNFKALFAPILVVGGGFGIGLGDPEQRVINGFAHFLAVIGGLAYVLCLDILESTAYQLISFMFPIFLGYLAAYIGIIIFAVYPGLLYSNLVMIGFTPLTVWLCIPEMEDE